MASSMGYLCALLANLFVANKNTTNNKIQDTPYSMNDRESVKIPSDYDSTAEREVGNRWTDSR